MHADTLQPPSESTLRAARRQLGEPSDSRPAGDGEHPAPCSAARSRPSGPVDGRAADEAPDAAFTEAGRGREEQAAAGLAETEPSSTEQRQAARPIAQPDSSGGLAARTRRAMKRPAPSPPSDSEATESDAEPSAASRCVVCPAASLSCANVCMLARPIMIATPLALAWCSESDDASSDDDFAVPAPRRRPQVGAGMEKRGGPLMYLCSLVCV